jgi:hypothetical protein
MKKIVLFMFAMGVGISSASAVNCMFSCYVEQRDCLRAGNDAEACADNYLSCTTYRCGY